MPDDDALDAWLDKHLTYDAPRQTDDRPRTSSPSSRAKATNNDAGDRAQAGSRASASRKLGAHTGRSRRRGPIHREVLSTCELLRRTHHGEPGVGGGIGLNTMNLYST